MKKILSGLGVSSGKATGKVRIVQSAKDERSFLEGEILVTKITDPTMVMMMNKASAIICDIGGMTSHAAIVSRELGVPCIVGTKVATKILKDGDTVQVDANKGIVRKI